MAETTLRQKAGLLLFGVFLTLVILEIGLRALGALSLYLQDRHHRGVTYASNEYRILCLGESTTALGGENSYPSQLEKLLNQKSADTKFKVINKGVISTTSGKILRDLERNLDLYKPQMVVVMMGINDYAFPDPYKSGPGIWKVKMFLSELRVVKLVYLVQRHISEKLVEGRKDRQAEKNPSEEPGYEEKILKVTYQQNMKDIESRIAELQSLTEKGADAQKIRHAEELVFEATFQASMTSQVLSRRYLEQERYAESEEYLDKATRFMPQNRHLPEQWGELHLVQRHSQEALTYFQAALTLDPNNTEAMAGVARAFNQMGDPRAFHFYEEYLKRKPDDYWGFIELASWYREARNYHKALVHLTRAMEINLDNDRAYLDAGQVLDEQGMFKEEEALFLGLLKKYPKRFRFAQALGQLYEKQGQKELAAEYLKKAAQIDSSTYPAWTWVNYDKLVKKIRDRKIKLIVMQYPVRDVKVLKEYLGKRDGIIFVENRANFVKALEKGRYSTYFVDNFAYDFGHCSRAGNALIAENLANVILQKK